MRFLALRKIPALPVFVALLFVFSAAASAQVSSNAGGDPVALVRRASQNELRATNGGHPYRYKLHKKDEKGETTKEIVETKDGDVARLVEAEGKPLTPERRSAELQRLDDLMQHPELQEHRRKREKEDSDRANEMVRLLPDAFLYQNTGLVAGSSGPAWRLTFKPNPNFEPPDREAEVYHGMVGELWVDQAQERMVKLDAHLIDDVDFGWGILGKLYKGGSILVEQRDVGNRHWETTHMKLNLTGKALLFKALNFTTVEDAFDFRQVPTEMSYKDAIRMLTSDVPPQVAQGR